MHDRVAGDGGGAQALEQQTCRGRRVIGDGRLGELEERPGGAAEVAGLPEDREGGVEQLPHRAWVGPESAGSGHE